MKYTLDRITEGQCVFLKHPEEEIELIVPLANIDVKLAEGDIVLIESVNDEWSVKVLKEETEDMKQKVSNLLEKLKNKEH